MESRRTVEEIQAGLDFAEAHNLDVTQDVVACVDFDGGRSHPQCRLPGRDSASGRSYAFSTCFIP
ncbi:MAG: hypothetical protein ACHQT8_07270 [Chlamydiales bacterium]